MRKKENVTETKATAKAAAKAASAVSADTPVKSRIDFLFLISAKNCNPNGDPSSMNGGPRIDSNGYGMITAECIKHKIRRAMLLAGHKVLVASAGDAGDGYTSIKSRLENNPIIADYLAENKKNLSADALAALAKQEWLDVRAFGALIPFSDYSFGVAGPVSINTALSVSPVDVDDIGITKCVNAQPKKKNKKDEDGNYTDELEETPGKTSDTMGVKSIVRFGLYVVAGSISPYQAERTGLTYADTQALKEAILAMFEDDISAARPAGSLNVERLYWWDHSKDGNEERKCPSMPVRDVHASVKIEPKNGPGVSAGSMDDYDITYVHDSRIGRPEVYVSGVLQAEEE